MNRTLFFPLINKIVSFQFAEHFKHGTRNTEHGTRNTERFLLPSIMLLQMLCICHAYVMHQTCIYHASLKELNIYVTVAREYHRQNRICATSCKLGGNIIAISGQPGSWLIAENQCRLVLFIDWLKYIRYYHLLLRLYVFMFEYVTVFPDIQETRFFKRKK